ncbi:hypothetical protein SAMN02799630_03085 [Paenibacillus sp. UNCCL117]|uniref:hypothetical protein n=1 Tax=unclassified Paenibacillus TaxID=185978 RepID=UPI000888D235|nr:MULTISPECIES: hypothetical protein [unclassified Paenibacillus]SDD92370.1 hypothetical protein SAMN04488602_115101 [Paenibacillus sp. cl123]SFW43492.1 hypothetical protein SAMN02799630_03085 [Paenibacillus sp. UNCCL117]
MRQVCPGIVRPIETLDGTHKAPVSSDMAEETGALLTCAVVRVCRIADFFAPWAAARAYGIS